jgi:hypothetical protein
VCGRPTDATFREPWAHEARGYKIRHDLRGPAGYRRDMAELEQHVWAYKDAHLRGDRAAADAAWQAYRRARPADWQSTANWWIGSGTMYQMVRLAAESDDLDLAADELLECYPYIDTHDVDNDNTTRTIARTFVSMCIEVLGRESSIDHPREAELYAAMRDIAARTEGVLMDHHHRGFQRIGEMRALRRSGDAMARARRSSVAAIDGLPPLAWPPARGAKPPTATAPPSLAGLNPWMALTLADAAIDTAELHDDAGPLEDLAERLGKTGAFPGLAQLVRARLFVVNGDLPAAVRELEQGAHATDRRLRPQLLATHGLLRARINPGELDRGIALCRAGRAVGLRGWRRVTAADAVLARLLLWRALRAGTPPARQISDVREAVRLIRRRSRPWHVHGADDRLLLQEALAARDALTGRGDDEQRNRAWRDAVAAPWATAARARLAVAWAEWAVGTAVAEYAAEAYERLVAMTSQDASTRYGAGAKQRVLVAAQEYAEEAGYWLCRAGRYREAVLALETGRAVGLTEALGRDNTAVLQQLRAAGLTELADEYRRAIEDFDEQERSTSAKLGPVWTQLQDVARRVAAATGADPLSLAATYDDITAETGDGAIVYLAAAKAGGYALVVAARHDPQYVDLPKLDRAAVAGIVGKVVPEIDMSSGVARFAAAGGPTRTVRDIMPADWQETTDPAVVGLRRLWQDGVKDLVLLSARGRVVTLVPVGLLSLLPLHAAGEPGTPGDRMTEWRHIGHFSSIRYAPNARSLRRCRDTVRGLTGQDETLLAIDVPDGFGVAANSHLSYVARETAEVTRRWTGRPARPVHACTWAEFCSAAETHTVWHLACHGSAEPGSIMDSRLFFADRQVTLGELRRALRPGRRRLAVLSACQTNLTGSAMPNEVLGLPSALVQIGFAGVIATAWTVDDLATTYLMTVFYQRWCRDGDEPAVALNHAQQWLRGATRGDLVALLPDVEPAGGTGQYPYVDPRYWAAFAYTGA